MTFVFRFSTFAVVLVLATKVGFVALDVVHREDGLPIEKRVAKLIDESSRHRDEWEESFDGVADIIEAVSIVRHKLTRIFDRLASATKAATARASSVSFHRTSKLVSNFCSMMGNKGVWYPIMLPDGGVK